MCKMTAHAESERWPRKIGLSTSTPRLLLKICKRARCGLQNLR